MMTTTPEIWKNMKNTEKYEKPLLSPTYFCQLYAFKHNFSPIYGLQNV